jgi:hypothetical protein
MLVYSVVDSNYHLHSFQGVLVLSLRRILPNRRGVGGRTSICGETSCPSATLQVIFFCLRTFPNVLFHFGAPSMSHFWCDDQAHGSNESENLGIINSLAVSSFVLVVASSVPALL